MFTTYIAISMLVIAIIGAVPLGLVNLSVMDTAYRQSKNHAMKIASGAAGVEVLYVALALFAGEMISRTIDSHHVLSIAIGLLPATVGIVFLVKRQDRKETSKDLKHPVAKGIFLNLLSLQVLLYWLVAIVWLNTRFDITLGGTTIALSLAMVWIGKMGVLWIYVHFSKPLMMRLPLLAKHTYKVIGIILLGTSIFQLEVI